MPSHPSHAVAERHALADALAAAGPEAPTLCHDWTARDLAAHVVVRDRRPDTLPGILLPPLAGWTERVRRRSAAADFDDLVAKVRSGPPLLTPSGLAAKVPGAEEAINLVEFFVHAEDVRRAGKGAPPRDLPGDRRDALWRALAARGRLLFRRSPVGVTLVTPDGRRRTVIDRGPGVELHGEPEELLLYAHGRGAQAAVEVTGGADDVQRFLAVPLKV